ncbi:GntR family transcriptional regulator [Planomonospora sp. ID91781]|uniref:Transcriptional regulator n=3 Tax=Planomonospora TaxID=1998 RepID=A0A161LLX3_9ACTN|nr:MULTISPECIES: GntR family transcriptional regulator [Planomonospora]MBG0820387.1 GntR family transcriptional regulator [Planomonospora sp. ID91781]GAT68105.1 transcriptional regulator [Planomonospora sphaerica]GGK95124.1 GntR family transcriptional regulator [Planomonospora parontospora]GII12490.1 GntR family transcriptional regulator [Planomonospora parontospora subsp. parontospora]
MTVPLRPVSAVTALTEELRRRVLSGEIPPGTALPEQELSAAYGVARPTVREALAALVHEGLLRRERHRSAQVAEVTGEDLDDLMFVRRPLEDLMAASLAGRRVAEADGALERMAALPGDAPWSDVVAEHMALHQALIVAVGSPRLERLYAALAAETRLGLVRLRDSYADRDVLVAEHRDLLDAIGAGSQEAARRAVAAHLDHGWGAPPGE